MAPDATSVRTNGLEGLLEAQARLFAELRELVVMQREALLAADGERIEQLASLASTLAERFRLLDRERQRLEGDAPPAGPRVQRARDRVAEALSALLRDAAVAGLVFERLGDSVAARQAAVAAMLAASYMPNGRVAAAVPKPGARLAAEG